MTDGIESQLTTAQSPIDINGVTLDDLARIAPDVHRQMQRTSLGYFCASTLTGPPDPPYRGRFLVGDLQMEWDQLVHNESHVCVQAARDHGKSFFFNLGYPIWRVYHEVDRLGYIFSASKEQAIALLEMIVDEISSNPKLMHLLPQKDIAAHTRWKSRKSKNKKLKYNKTEVQFTNGCTIRARGFGSRVRGGHPHWIVCDDILNDEDIYSDIVRNKHIDYFLSAIIPMLVDTYRPPKGGPLIGQMILVGTPFHLKDLYGYLTENPEFAVHVFAAVRPNGQPLVPARYSLERLEKTKRLVGPIRFAREYMCVPISDEMSLFPRKLFAQEGVMQYNVPLGAPLTYWKQLGIKRVITGHDFAISSEAGSDYSVNVVLGIDGTGNLWIMDLQRYHGEPYQSQLNRINEIGVKYKPELMVIEANQMQRIFGDELKRMTSHPIWNATTTAQSKNSLEFGVPSLRVFFENSKFRIPRGDAHSIEVTDLLIEELTNFGWDHKGKLQALSGHDDMVMGLFNAFRGYREGVAFTHGMGIGKDELKKFDYYKDTLGLQTKEEVEAYLNGELDPSKKADKPNPFKNPFG